MVVTSRAWSDPPPGKGYVMVFDDEFNGSKLNQKLWNYNYPWGTYHNGRANMQPSQVTVKNGLLTLTAIDKRTITNPWGYWNSDWNKYVPYDYTSGTINTYGKASWHYGYFEGRFKMPPDVSTWPAFWMLQNGWPPELDIFELAGSRATDYYTYHYTDSTGNPASLGGQWTGADMSVDWHTYGVEWTPTTLTFYVDDQAVQSFDAPDEIAQMGEMYFLIDLQVGGWAPDPNGANYPQQLQCDWVRVWQVGGPATNIYRLTPQNAQDKAMEVNGYSQSNGAQVDIWSANSGVNQQWDVLRNDDGSYVLQAYPGWNWLDQVLDDNAFNVTNGSSVTTWQANGGSNQNWYFQDTGNGWYRIIPANGPYSCLDIANAGTTDGSVVDIWQFTSASSQLWRLDPPLGPLTLTSLAVGSVTDTGATVTWNTTYPTDTTLAYGLTRAYGATLTGQSGVTAHSITLTGLSQATTYHFRVRATDAYGEKVSSPDQTFTTVSDADLTLQNVTANRNSATNQIVVIATLGNSGTAAAANVKLTRATLGSHTTLTKMPIAIGAIAVGSAVPVTIRFASQPSGATVTLTLTGVLNGGSFTFSQSLQVP
jgi:beta-glucanase (GH16 family)